MSIAFELPAAPFGFEGPRPSGRVSKMAIASRLCPVLQHLRHVAREGRSGLSGLSFSSASTRRWSSSTAAFLCPPHQAIIYETHGAPDRVVKLVEVPERSLENGEICVKMLAAPINPSDINRIEGVYPVRPELPAVAGNEGVGTVVGVGAGVKNLAVNDWVIPAHSTTGTWATHAIQNEAAWYKVPHDIPVEYLATISINPSSAFRMLKDFVTLEAGETVVQNGATSMVGQCVIQLCHSWGLQTINLVRDRDDLDEVKHRLKQLGATHVFSQSEMEGVNKKELFAGMAPPKLGLNCVGGLASSSVLKLLGEGGTMVTYGGMSKKPINVSTASFIFKDLQLKGFFLHNWIKSHGGADFMTMSDELLALVRDGKLRYSMEKVPFSSFDLALQRAMGKRGSVLKQVITFD